MKRIHSSWYFLGSIYGGLVIATVNPIARAATALSLYQLYRSRKAVEDAERELRRATEHADFTRKFHARQSFDSYEAYLKSEVWRIKRALVVKRALGRCENKGCDRALDEVHHLRYPRVWGNEPIHWLIGLCENHHREAHGHAENIVKR